MKKILLLVAILALNIGAFAQTPASAPAPANGAGAHPKHHHGHHGHHGHHEKGEPKAK
jgi:Spy/CpxP family protein refolding chaperone